MNSNAPSDNGPLALKSNEGLGARVLALVEAALWWHYCPKRGGYRHDGDRYGRAIEDTCDDLVSACDALGGQPRDCDGLAWMSEEDAEHAIKPLLDRVAEVLAPNVRANRPAVGGSGLSE